MNKLIDQAKKIKCFICDVDGVLTDGLLYLDNHGNELKTFHVHDGMGLKFLMAAGIHTAVITTSRNAVIDHRMQQLGIEHYFKGQVNKQPAFDELKARLKLDNEQIAYIGDDLPDLPLIQQAGLGIAVANAASQVRHIADWVTTKNGGRGAVREACDLILEAQQKQHVALTGYLNS